MPSTGDPARFHLLLTSAGRPVVHGWWGSEANARRKLVDWVGEYGGMPDARITLTDETTGEVLDSWPGPARLSVAARTVEPSISPCWRLC